MRALTRNWLSANSFHTKVCTVLALSRNNAECDEGVACNQRHYTAE